MYELHISITLTRTNSHEHYRDVWLENESEICILLEYCKDGTLNDLISKVAAQVPLIYIPENV